jgi:hypothetical protein
MARSTVATVNGRAIRKVQSRFGKLYQVGTTSALEAATTFASKKKGASGATGNRAQVSRRRMTDGKNTSSGTQKFETD